MDWSAVCSYQPRAISNESARAFDAAASSLFPAQRSQCIVYGKSYTVPRDQFVVNFSDSKGDEYSYSNHTIPVRETFPELDAIRAQVEELLNTTFNLVLVNRYKDGHDTVGWHADDEALIDQTSPIASVSIGDTRDFDLRVTKDPKVRKRFALRDLDLVVMKPGCQQTCQHQLPRRAKAGCRINLTFRRVSAMSRKRKIIN